MNPAIVERLQQILQCSSEMLEAAREERWDELVALEATRAGLLRAHADATADPRSIDDPETVADYLGKILEASAGVVELGERHRQRLAADIADSRRQRRVVGAYAACSGPAS